MGSLLSAPQPDPKWKSEAQFAMESSCFCVVCGSPFNMEGEVYNLDTTANRYKVDMEAQFFVYHWLTMFSGCDTIACLVAGTMSIITILGACQKKIFGMYIVASNSFVVMFV